MNKVVLDACVLYPAPLRDFLLSLANEELFEPKWTYLIHEEWVRNLLKKRQDLTRSNKIYDAKNRDSHENRFPERRC